MDDRTVLSVCRDEDCPACGWPEPCRNCGRTDRLRTPIRLDDGSPAFVRCVDALGCRAEQERQDGHAG